MQTFAVEAQRAARPGRIAPDGKPRHHPRALLLQVEIEIDTIDQVGWWLVVRELDRTRSGFFHVTDPELLRRGRNHIDARMTRQIGATLCSKWVNSRGFAPPARLLR